MCTLMPYAEYIHAEHSKPPMHVWMNENSTCIDLYCLQMCHADGAHCCALRDPQTSVAAAAEAWYADCNVDGRTDFSDRGASSSTCAAAVFHCLLEFEGDRGHGINRKALNELSECVYVCACVWDIILYIPSTE